VTVKTASYTLPSFTGTYKYGSGSPSPNTWTQVGTISISLPGTAEGEAIVTNPNVVAPPSSGQVMLRFNNSTGATQTIPWGSGTLTLAPGMNNIRYDGPINADGFPLDVPSDFTGTLNIADGKSELFANLQFATGTATDGGRMWGPPPVIDGPPTATSDSYEWINRPTATQPGTLVITRTDGTRQIIGYPATGPTPQIGTSVATAGTSILSNPTSPAPTNSTSNTSNVFNFNTTNIQNTSSTSISNSVDSSGAEDPTSDAAAIAAVNALQGDGGDDNPDIGLGESLQAMTDGFYGQQTSTLAKVVSSFQGFDQVLAVSAVPKIMTYSNTISLGFFGSQTLNINFANAPFPQVRNALLCVMTLLLTMEFMKRVTI